MGEQRLASVETEKDILQRSVDELHQINHDFSTETDESQSTLTSESMQWNEEKRELSNLLKDSEIALAMVDGEKQNLEGDKENSKKIPPQKSIIGLAPESMPSRPRVSSRSRMLTRGQTRLNPTASSTAS